MLQQWSMKEILMFDITWKYQNIDLKLSDSCTLMKPSIFLRRWLHASYSKKILGEIKGDDEVENEE